MYWKRAYRGEEEIPYEPFEIDAIEGWLDEHTRRGLRLKSCRGRCCTFAPAEAGETMTRYRLDVKRQFGDDLGRRDEFRELGWEYVDRLSGRVDVYRAARPDAVEINTDSEALQSVLRRSYRWQAAEALFCLLGAALALWGVGVLLRRDGGLFPSLLGSDALLVPVGMLLVLYCLWAAVFLAVTTLRARRRDLTERQVHSPALARRRKRLRWGMLWVLMAVNVLRLIPGAVAPRMVAELTPLPAADCPVAAWEELCPGEGSVLLARQRELLSDHQLTYRQEDAALIHRLPEEGPGYRADVYECRWSALADGLRWELLRGQEARAVAVDGWDEGWTWETGAGANSVQHLLLRGGRDVLTAEYRGAGDLAASAALFAR